MVSSALTNRDPNWASALKRMREGALLRWESSTGRYYADGSGGLTERVVLRIMSEGLIRRLDAVTFVLVQEAADE